MERDEEACVFFMFSIPCTKRYFFSVMTLFGPKNGARPDSHGKILSLAERKAAIRRVETELSILSSERLKLNRQKTDRDLELRKARDQRRRLDVEIENLEKQAKKDEVNLRDVEENIRLAKKRLVVL